jgi:hypothetical protein
MGECRNRSPPASRTTVIRVVNGSGSLTPAIVKYSSGPSTTPMFGPKDLYSLRGSYRWEGAPRIFAFYTSCVPNGTALPILSHFLE